MTPLLTQEDRGQAGGVAPKGASNQLGDSRWLLNKSPVWVMVPSDNYDGVFTGRESHTTHQELNVKLFNAIAAAAVVGSIFRYVSCSCRGRQWLGFMQQHQSRATLIYVRPLSRNGNLVTYEETLSGEKSRFVANQSCMAVQEPEWNLKRWRDVMPNSIGAAAHRTVCSANIPTFTPRARPSNVSYVSCNEKVDAVFYRRYPELKGTKLNQHEWISRKENGCPSKTLSADTILLVGKPDATAERLRAIQDPQGKSRGRCVSPSISRQNNYQPVIRNQNDCSKKKSPNVKTRWMQPGKKPRRNARV